MISLVFLLNSGLKGNNFSLMAFWACLHGEDELDLAFFTNAEALMTLGTGLLIDFLDYLWLCKL